MNSGRLNVVLGAAGLVLAGFGGFALGMTIDPFFEKGFAAYPLTRFLLRSAHAHGMLVSLLNLVVGVLLSRLAMSDKAKKICSAFAAGAFLLPIALLLRGLTGGGMTFAPFGVLGGLCLVTAAAVLAVGALKPASAQ